MIVIVIVLSRGYDRGADIRVSYARTGCLVDMVRESTIREMGHLGIWLRESSICLDFDSVSSTYMVTGEFHMRGVRLCVVVVMLD